MNRRFGSVLLMVFACALLAPPVFAEGTLYLKYNVHVQDQVGRNGEHVYKASYSGWVDALPPVFLLPAGSEVTVGPLRRGFVPAFTIQGKDDGRLIAFEYQEKYMGISVDEYIAKITSPTPVSLAALSKIDREGVKAGKALVGMSKQGVVTALGLPPTHKTPSLDDNSWTYWKDKYRTLVVEFDGTGTVRNIRE
ncbi:MAG: hypothetical protein A2091_05945 [Desulfuromonadales bacterium GWD2_61_12]|nr:MAG: hypothetical protein A2005_11120 [Desulfuromonadales bacterium GWC2_61_20]OGR35680.1 MAG: hypothetical protein A2091_05945 [Desulfuromonadales bacterium GWD2_61_12]HAD04635.1 hypothetical protein [Desulfuromonas sp.]HBT82672.1 hypothetical protein [Desulfuromonas sp.]